MLSFSLSSLPSVTPSILKAMSERQFEFTSFKRVRVAMGTWNVNGGKQFRSNILGTSELTDWLLDSPKLSGVSEFQGKTSESIRYCNSYCLSRICKSEHQVWWPLPFRVNASSWRAFSANPKGCIQPHLDLYSLFCILHFILFLRFSILGYLFWGETLCLGAPGIVSLFFILPFLSSIEGSCVSSLLKLATEFHMYWTQSVTVIYFKILLRKMKSECSII